MSFLSLHMTFFNIINLYVQGHAVVSVKPLVDVNIPQSIWSMFLNESLSQISEQYLTHAVKMLNIFHHVLNDMVPTVQSQPKNVLSNLPAPGNLSPMKRRKSDLDKKLLVTIKTEKDDKNEKKDGSKPNSTMTSFSCSTRYLRIFDILKTAFVNYKVRCWTFLNYTCLFNGPILDFIRLGFVSKVLGTFSCKSTHALCVDGSRNYQ